MRRSRPGPAAAPLAGARRQRVGSVPTAGKRAFEILILLLDLERMEPRDEEAAEAIRKLRGYFKENQGRVKYGSLRRRGYSIGSGGSESANKCISHVRRKRSGAWWYAEWANVMLALRCAKYNGTFERGSLRTISRRSGGVGEHTLRKKHVMLPNQLYSFHWTGLPDRGMRSLAISSLTHPRGTLCTRRLRSA